MKINPIRLLAVPSILCCVTFGLLAPIPAAGQSLPGGPPPGSPERLPADVTREQMWPAPTAEDWKRPCLITFQRSWEDAVAVSTETGKPILICVNMDGEIASEHYAGIRYRDPETAKLYEPYVCVIASVYRHNPRDYDEQGNRILCPRFGSVTCGEHIAIEPILYSRFFEEKRIAPRHISIEPDGEETYDVYYAWDTESVFHTIEEGAAGRPEAPAIVRGDRPIVERVASRDIQDRVAVERAYREGDKALRESLLEAAIEHPEAAQVDLLRQAVFGFDVDLSKLARRALAATESETAYPLIAEALRVPMEAGERETLINTLSRIGRNAPRARMLAVVHQGLAARSELVDAAGWAAAIENAAPQALEGEAQDFGALMSRQDEVLASDDASAHVDLAEAFLGEALVQTDGDQKSAEYLLKDAHRVALRAQALGAYGWKVNAVAALADYYLENTEDAYARAEAAVRGLPCGEPGWLAVAALDLFAEQRWKAIAQAVQEKRDWKSWTEAFAGTGHWLTDLHAAYAVLEEHPLGTDAHVASHYDFLNLLGADGPAAGVLEAGLARFPDSPALHARLRGRILREKGVEGLETVYEARLREEGSARHLESFAGYASIVAAEFYRRFGKEAQALDAYQKAIDHYDRSIAAGPENKEEADHYAALAIAGQARLAFERGDFEAALDDLLASLGRKPEAAATPDGLNITPMDTARMLRQKFKELNREDLLAKLEAALSTLDPALLELPAYERMAPDDRPPEGTDRRGPPRRRGNRERE